MKTITIDPRFNGPDHTGNGGYVCGLIAGQLKGPESPRTASLRLPPPLGVPLIWDQGDGYATLLASPGVVVGTATPGTFKDEVLASPTLAQAQAGTEAYPGFHNHPFNHCFTCGTAREEGDGLRLFTGPISDSTVAAPWSPHEAFGEEDGSIGVPIMWAALDCPGGWAADFTLHPIVLGRMTAEIYRRPVVGEQCLSIGGLQRRDGRKFFTNTALYSLEGELLGRAEQIWISIDLADFS
ncbi:MAG: hypothetical protein ABIR57_00535 [Aeromicrobium sp.]